MTRIRRILAFVMIFLLLSVVMIYADTYGKESLRGLRGVNIMVESLQPDIEKDGLRKSSIKTDVELKLRMAGIKVLTKEEREKEPGMPYLYVRVSSIKRETGLHVFNIDVELGQLVLLARDPKIICYYATTWRTTGEIGTIGGVKVNQLRDSIKDRVDEFINDYLEMNPKE